MSVGLAGATFVTELTQSPEDMTLAVRHRWLFNKKIAQVDGRSIYINTYIDSAGRWHRLSPTKTLFEEEVMKAADDQIASWLI